MSSLYAARALKQGQTKQLTTVTRRARADGTVAADLSDAAGRVASLIATTQEWEAICRTMQPASTPTPTPTADVPAGWKVFWEDNFDGPHGPLDPAKWFNGGLAAHGFLGLCASKPENIFRDGYGNCVIRTKRERVTVGSAVREFSTGLAHTFKNGYAAPGNTPEDGAWPPAEIAAKWPTPHRIEAVIRLPDLGGFWGGAWLMAVDQRRSTVGVPEIDFAELRRSSNRHDGHQHLWKWDATQGKVVDAPYSIWNGAVQVPCDLLVPHKYWAEVYADKVIYGIDDHPTRATCGWGRQAQYGMMLNGGIGDINNPDSRWGAAGGVPVGDGPWDTVISNVRALVPA